MHRPEIIFANQSFPAFRNSTLSIAQLANIEIAPSLSQRLRNMKFSATRSQLLAVEGILPSIIFFLIRVLIIIYLYYKNLL